ncbi:hypothetical protein D3C76_1509880 [compost metagenome]
MLSTSPTIITKKPTIKNPCHSCCVANRKMAAGTQIMAEPTAGMSDRNAISAPHRTLPSMPAM